VSRDEVKQMGGIEKADRLGGMASKLQAVKVALDAGIPTVIASGRTPGVIPGIVAGHDVGTRFIPVAAGGE
jgi:glutamate 5-kinase